ncbi:MAG: hypothetical protein Hals2KO_12270 [Halioglobus sp.]
MSRFYTLKIVAAFLVGTTLLATFNYWVNPYRAFEQKDITTSSDLIYYFRQIKAEQLRKAPGQLLILGSSRVAVMRPTLNAGEGYNAALPGMTSYEMLQTLRHANHFSPTRQLIVGLDFSAFMDTHPKFRFGFSEERMVNGFVFPPNWSAIKHRLRDLYQLLLSAQASTASLHTVLGLKPAQLDFYHDGTWRTKSVTRQVPRRQKFSKIGKQYFELASQSSAQHNLDYLAELVRYSYAAGIDARFFISPVHATTLAVYREAGQLEHMLRWQRDVIELLDREAWSARSAALPLLGFQTADAITEPIEKFKGKAFFIDGIHYSPLFGDLIRNDVLYGSQGVATRLTRTSLESYWSESLLRLQHYEQANRRSLRAFLRQAGATK